MRGMSDPKLVVSKRVLAVSEDTKRRNPDLYGASASRLASAGVAVAVESKPMGTPPTRAKFIIKPSTDEDRLNKTERAYLTYLREQSYASIKIQAVTLKLGDDCRYTPDFFTVDRNGEGVFHEVKGFWRDDARVKIKVAAREFPVKFIAVQKAKGGGWTVEEINP
jgi:hypothetical protein